MSGAPHSRAREKLLSPACINSRVHAQCLHNSRRSRALPEPALNAHRDGWIAWAARAAGKRAAWPVRLHRGCCQPQPDVPEAQHARSGRHEAIPNETSGSSSASCNKRLPIPSASVPSRHIRGSRGAEVRNATIPRQLTGSENRSHWSWWLSRVVVTVGG